MLSTDDLAALRHVVVQALAPHENRDRPVLDSLRVGMLYDAPRYRTVVKIWSRYGSAIDCWMDDVEAAALPPSRRPFDVWRPRVREAARANRSLLLGRFVEATSAMVTLDEPSPKRAISLVGVPEA